MVKEWVELGGKELLRVLDKLGLAGSPVYFARRYDDGSIAVLVPGALAPYVARPSDGVEFPMETPADVATEAPGPAGMGGAIDSELPLPAGPKKWEPLENGDVDAVDFSVIKGVGKRVTEALHLVGVSSWVRLDDTSDADLLTLPSVNRAVLRALRGGARGARDAVRGSELPGGACIGREGESSLASRMTEEVQDDEGF